MAEATSSAALSKARYWVIIQPFTPRISTCVQVSPFFSTFSTPLFVLAPRLILSADAVTVYCLA